jgi:hypothetical protein
MIVQQPTFVGAVSGIGTSLITLTPIPGLAVGDFLVMFAASINGTWVGPTPGAGWSTLATGNIQAAASCQGSFYTRKWTGGEAASFWQITPNATDRTTVAVVAYRGCDPSFQQFGNAAANGTVTTVANGLMTTNSHTNLLAGVANGGGTTVLFGLANRQDNCTACNPPTGSQAGAFTQRVFQRGPVFAGTSPTIYVGDSQTMPQGIAGYTMPNGNGGWTAINATINTATFALFLIPPTITQVQRYCGAGADVGSGLPHPAFWNTANNITADDNVRATTTNNGISTDTDWLRATNFGFTIPTSASIMGIQFATAMRGWTPTAALNPPSAQATYCLTNPATAAPDVPTTTQSHVQNLSGTKINSPTASNPADGNLLYGGFLNVMNRAAWPIPADVNSSNFGYCWLLTIDADPGGAQSYNYEVDSMQMNLFVWQGTDITPAGGGPLLFSEA